MNREWVGRDGARITLDDPLDARALAAVGLAAFLQILELGQRAASGSTERLLPPTSWRTFTRRAVVSHRHAGVFDTATRVARWCTIEQLLAGDLTAALTEAIGDRAPEVLEVARIRTGAARCRCDEKLLVPEQHGLLADLVTVRPDDVPVDIRIVTGRCRACTRTLEFTITEVGNGRYDTSLGELAAPPAPPLVFDVWRADSGVVQRGVTEAEARRLVAELRAAGADAHYDPAERDLLDPV